MPACSQRPSSEQENRHGPLDCTSLSGQTPAYEWNFSDVNPPVHASAPLLSWSLGREMGVRVAAALSVRFIKDSGNTHQVRGRASLPEDEWERVDMPVMRFKRA